jgi:hypothetical protein
MQRRYTAPIDRVRVRASTDEVRDHLALCIRIHEVLARVPIRGVVERLGSPSVAGANRGSSYDERLGESSVVGGGADVQRRAFA